MLDHLALQCADPGGASAFYTTVFAAEILHAARVWPEYHPAYYGVFLRDPDGNNVEAVCHALD